MQTEIRRAQVSDLEELLKLYFTVYGSSYPLAMGTDRKVMQKVIEKAENLWLVACDGPKLVGCLSFEVDPLQRIARAQGLLVLPEKRSSGLASKMLQLGTHELLEVRKSVNSIYATTRTVTKGPQLVFLRNGFVPLGIFPNAHRLKEYETVTLMAKFSDDALTRRADLPAIPASLAALVDIVEKNIGSQQKMQLSPPEQLPVIGDELDFELISAPAFVRRAFNERMQNPYDRFYPFHEPNLLMASTNGEVEIFAHFNSDGYCTIVGLTKACWELHGRIRPLLHQLRLFGVSYLEILMGVEHTPSLGALLAAQFLPSAYYPAMYEIDGRCHDMVLMSRSMEPLDFRGIEIEHSFKPFVDQYTSLWKKMHLEVLEIFHDE